MLIEVVIASSLYLKEANPGASQLSAPWLTKLLDEHEAGPKIRSAAHAGKLINDTDELAETISSVENSLSASEESHLRQLAEAIKAMVPVAVRPALFAAMSQVSQLIDITSDSVKTIPGWRDLSGPCQTILSAHVAALELAAHSSGLGGVAHL